MSDSGSHSGFGEFLANLIGGDLNRARPKTIKEADALAKPLVKRWVILAVGVSWVPGSTFVLGGVDLKIFSDLAKIYRIPNFNVDAMMAAIGGSLVGRGTAEAAAWAFGVGWLTNPFIAGGITKKLSDLIMNYMRDKSPLPKE